MHVDKGQREGETGLVSPKASTYTHHKYEKQ